MDSDSTLGTSDTATRQWVRHEVLTSITRSETMHGPFTGPDFALGVIVDSLSLDEPLVHAYVASDADFTLDDRSPAAYRAVLTRFLEDRYAVLLPLVFQALLDAQGRDARLYVQDTTSALGMLQDGEYEDAVGIVRSLAHLLPPQGPAAAILSPLRNVPLHHGDHSPAVSPSLVQMRHTARLHGYADIRIPLLPEHDDEAGQGDALLAVIGAAAGVSASRAARVS